MTQVNVYDAKRHLSRLLKQVAAGEEVVIARAGRPVARLVPYERVQGGRRPGALAGRIEFADDFEWTDEELEELAGNGG